MRVGPVPLGWAKRAPSRTLWCVSFSQVQTFVAVAEEGSLSRAARRLHISQPPLTRQIHALEDELGVALFARSSRGMRLLPAGEAFLARARVVLAEVDAAVDAARRAGALVPQAP